VPFSRGSRQCVGMQYVPYLHFLALYIISVFKRPCLKGRKVTLDLVSPI
jgi:hypothetical protein